MKLQRCSAGNFFVVSGDVFGVENLNYSATRAGTLFQQIFNAAKLINAVPHSRKPWAVGAFEEPTHSIFSVAWNIWCDKV